MDIKAREHGFRITLFVDNIPKVSHSEWRGIHDYLRHTMQLTEAKINTIYREYKDALDASRNR